MADIQKIAEDLSTLTVLEASELTKLLEEKCNDNLRASGFPSFLEDKNQKQKAEEIII